VTSSAANGNGAQANSSTDRRLEKGRRRREQIVAAAAALSIRNGLGNLTHRQIAERAAVPLSATTYYFKTLTEIQVEATRHVTQRLVAQFAKELGNTEGNKLVDAARPLARALLPLRTSTVVGYQWYLGAVRIPEVRAVVAEWNHGVVGILADRFALETETAAEVVALADGLLLAATADESSRETTIRRLTRALTHFDAALRVVPANGSAPRVTSRGSSARAVGTSRSKRAALHSA
jgi:DNA-binding transcriptional regulator YbjK